MAEVSLELIQTMLERLLDGQRQMQTDLLDIKRRLTSLEVKIANLHADLAALHGWLDPSRVPGRSQLRLI